MVVTVFYFMLNMSIASCFVIIMLLLVRQIRPLPRRVVYPLWSLGFFRLIMPFTIPTSWSLFNFTGGLVKKVVGIDPVSTMNMIGAVERYAPLEYKTHILQQVFTISSVIWLIVAGALLLTAMVLHRLSSKELKQAIHIRDNLYHTDMVGSPLLVGLVRPRIILPTSLDPDSAEASMIVAHETIHQSRMDNLWRILGICVACLHWFNPLVWVMLKAFFVDMERSCDEAVIRRYSTVERKAYAATLLRFAEDKQLLTSTSFGRSGVKVRIVNVLNYRKLTLLGTLTSGLFLAILAIVLISNPPA